MEMLEKYILLYNKMKERERYHLVKHTRKAKLCNTQTANLIAVAETGNREKDPSGYLYQALYRKDSGTFFLYEVGGRNTGEILRKREAFDRVLWHDSDEISGETAKRWLQRNVPEIQTEDLDAFMEFFGYSQRRMVSYRLREECIFILEKYSALVNRPKQNIVEELILTLSPKVYDSMEENAESRTS